ILKDCARRGWVPTDAEVKEKVQELPYFKKEGRFDLPTYRAVLAANQFTPGGFEKTIREDLTLQRWSESLKGRVQVSEDEILREFKAVNDKRNIKFVMFDAETGRKAVTVSDVEIDTFVKDPTQLARAKSRFESLKTSQYKNKKFEEVQRQVVRDVLAGEKTEAIREANLKLADRVLPLLGKASDAQVNAAVASVGASVKSSGLVNRQSTFIQGLGEAKEVIADAFAEKSPIDLSQGGKAKKYTSGGWVAVAVVAESQRPDLSKLVAKQANEKSKLEDQIRIKKQRLLEEDWLQALRDRAKIEMDPQLSSG
ncbi:MAG: SurA N-terminal domain-containing protein, partial [Oligoflexia bacterium]